MDIFDVLTLIGGLCLFLFGMRLFVANLKKRAYGYKLATSECYNTSEMEILYFQ